MTRLSLPVLAATLLLLAAPAAHAFTVESADGHSGASLTDPDERLTPHDDGHGTVTNRFGNFESTVTTGTVWQSSPRLGYPGAAGLLPWDQHDAPQSPGWPDRR